MQLIHKYFPNLTGYQYSQYEQLHDLYGFWNEKVNVVSRKDIDNIYERHILHSLAIAKFTSFKEGTRVLDIGTGGGFPAIPFAIFFPEVEFLAVDSIEKKIKVVQEISTSIGLKNLRTQHTRVERVKEKFDFAVTRAVAPLSDLLMWSRNLFHPIQFNDLDNGLIALKGGDLTEEIKAINKKVAITPIQNYFEESFFETKCIVYVKMSK